MTEPNPTTSLRVTKALFIAALAGVVSTMLGVGGGVVMVPLLAMFGVMGMKQGAGTSLAVITFVIVVGLVAQLHVAPHDIQWTTAGLLIVGSVCGAFVGRWIHRRVSEGVFRYVFCVLMILIALRMAFELPQLRPLSSGAMALDVWWHVAFVIGVGLAAGIVSALFGLGGGVVAVPLLALGFEFFHERFTATRATSLVMILPTSMVGAWLHFRAGNVDVGLAGRMIPMAVLGALGGVFLAYEVPQATLRVLFAVMLLLASLRIGLRILALRRKNHGNAGKKS